MTMNEIELTKKEIIQEIENNLPLEIDGFQRCIVTIGTLNTIIYTKSVKYGFKNIKTTNSELYDENEINKNVLYEVKSNDLQICYQKMNEKIFLNNKVKKDFPNNEILGFTTNLVIYENGFKTFYKSYEIYIVLDTNSDSQFFVAVSVNPIFDCGYIIETISKLKKQFIDGSLIKLSNDEFNYSDFNPPKVIHFYSFSFLDKKQELREQFRKRGWNVKYRDNLLFEKEKSRKNERIILCEGKNYKILNSIKIPNVVFSEEHNCVSIFQNVKTRAKYCLRDKDYLIDDEVLRLKRKFPKYYILEYYCIENFLYHPDNIEELNLKEFDKKAYIENIIQQKNELLKEIISEIESIRNGYLELRENHIKKVDNNIEILKSELKSDDLQIFYKHFDMKKKYKRDILMRYNLNPNKLSNTNWFKNKIKKQLV